MEYLSVNQPHAKGIKAVPGEQQDHAQYCLYKQHWLVSDLNLRLKDFVFRGITMMGAISSPSPAHGQPGHFCLTGCAPTYHR